MASCGIHYEVRHSEPWPELCGMMLRQIPDLGGIKPGLSSRWDRLTADGGRAARSAGLTEVGEVERKAQTTLDTEATRILYAARPAR